MRIAVAGGTGVVGRLVAASAQTRGHEVVVLARATGVDLTTGEGLDLTGVDVVIDATSMQTNSASTSREFFRSVTSTLQEAEREAGVRHHIALSIVGVDDVPYGYYAGKLEHERAVSAMGVPWTVLRATQFHEFAAQIFHRMRNGPVSFIPIMKSQPIAAAEVAARLVELAEAEPAGRVKDLAGPRVERMGQLSRQWARAAGVRGRVVEFPLPGGLGTAMRDGTLLPGPTADIGRQTFAQWLQQDRD